MLVKRRDQRGEARIVRVEGDAAQPGEHTIGVETRVRGDADGPQQLLGRLDTRGSQVEGHVPEFGHR